LADDFLPTTFADDSWDPNTPQANGILVSDSAKKVQQWLAESVVAEINTTKERVSSRSFKQGENISLVPTSVAAKGLPVETSRRTSSVPFCGGEAAAENRCVGQ